MYELWDQVRHLCSSRMLGLTFDPQENDPMPDLIRRTFDGQENAMQFHRQNFVKREGRVEGESRFPARHTVCCLC